ncbi:MAG: transcriptional regulator [archaeon]
MYSLPQEIEVWYIIPGIRRELARELTQKHDLTYEKAGNILGVSKAAISQYLKNKRAKEIKFSDSVKKEIEKSAKVIVKDNKMAVREIMRLISVVKKSKCACDICKKHNKGILDICEGKVKEC